MLKIRLLGIFRTLFLFFTYFLLFPEYLASPFWVPADKQSEFQLTEAQQQQKELLNSSFILSLSEGERLVPPPIFDTSAHVQARVNAAEDS